VKWTVRACYLELINSKIITIADSSSFFPINRYPITDCLPDIFCTQNKKIKASKSFKLSHIRMDQMDIFIDRALSNQENFVTQLYPYSGFTLKKIRIETYQVFNILWFLPFISLE
jgi:hypothetical protein